VWAPEPVLPAKGLKIHSVTVDLVKAELVEVRKVIHSCVLLFMSLQREWKHLSKG